MKKIFAVLLSAIMLAVFMTGFQVSASAATSSYGTDGDWDYYVRQDGTAQIYAYNGTKTEITIPSKVSGITVTSLGSTSGEFRSDNTELKVLNIPEGVTDIYEGCLAYNWYLENINVDSNNTKYSSVNGVLYSKGKWTLYAYPGGRTETSFKIPSTVRRIGVNAFYSANNLESVTIPDSVTEIRETAFHNTGLTSVTIPASVETLAQGAFEGNFNLKKVVFADGFKRLDNNSFSGSYLTRLNIPASVEYIAEGAFSYLPMLHEVTVDAANENYCAYGGNLCSKDKSVLLFRPTGKSATSVTIGAPIKRIGNNAFYGTDDLQEVIIKNGVQEIGFCAFSNCYNLAKITLPDSMNKIEGWAFAETNITEVNIPDNVTKIEDNTFYECAELQSVEMSDTVTEIGSFAFEGCYNLSYVKLSENLKTINDSAFSSCVKLTDITLPQSLETIDSYAFCPTGIRKITIPPSVTDIKGRAIGFYTSDDSSPIPGFEIYGISGTEAQRYAEYYGISFINTGNLLGDVNSDGQIDIDDATAIQRYIADISTLTDYEKIAADIDLSGDITISDATTIQKIIAEII